MRESDATACELGSDATSHSGSIVNTFTETSFTSTDGNGVIAGKYSGLGTVDVTADIGRELVLADSTGNVFACCSITAGTNRAEAAAANEAYKEVLREQEGCPTDTTDDLLEEDEAFFGRTGTRRLSTEDFLQ